MKRQLVFVHGRAQQGKNADALKAEWIDAFEEGLAKSGLRLPIAESDIRFPYYGDTLYQLVEGRTPDEAADVIVRGDGVDAEQEKFTKAVLEEIRRKNGVTEEQLAGVVGQDVVTKGPLNWEWVHGILKAIDKYIPHGSGTSIALFTNDVYHYLRNPIIRDEIESGIAAAMAPDVESVVVSHSLGTVVAYNLLRTQGPAKKWKVPLFVTLGSPLAITEIRKTLTRIAPARCPECATSWFNAMDERDVVSLYPLDAASFPLNPDNPSIENKTDVRNRTENRHGISGYLDDAEVAKRIHDALISE